MSAQDFQRGWHDPKGIFDPRSHQHRNDLFWSSKRAFDVALSLLLLPLLAVCAIVLLAANPMLNPGHLVFRQERMGQWCAPFTVLKFRTLRSVDGVSRRACDGLETDRISPFASFLRRMRIDELPQIINVLRGEMSLIGPRPDTYEHAREYLSAIPHYVYRYDIRPGISGLAQVTLGYAEGFDATSAKATCDLLYIRKAGFVLDMRVFWLTLRTVFGAKGV